MDRPCRAAETGLNEVLPIRRKERVTVRADNLSFCSLFDKDTLVGLPACFVAYDFPLDAILGDRSRFAIRFT
jgi:hypothetical protein